MPRDGISLLLCPRMSNSDEQLQERARLNALDIQLMQKVAAGDRAAFSQLYDRLSRPLYATALQIVRDAGEAEDIIQEVFLFLWDKARSFDSARGNLFSWTVTLTRNRAIDRIRKRQRRSEILDQSIPDDHGYTASAEETDASIGLETQENARAVRKAVSTLPADQQIALKLAFFSGLTQQEISDQLQAPLGTVKARIRRGLLKLREQLAPGA